MFQPRHLRAAYGAALLAEPRPVLQAIGASRDDRRLDLATRFLGARQLAEGILPRGARPILLAADAIHAASMVGFIALDPPRRRPAAATLATTCALAALTVVAPLSTGDGRPSTDHARRADRAGG